MRRNHRHFDYHHAVMVVDGNYIPMLEVSRRHAIKAVASGRAQVLDLKSWGKCGEVRAADWGQVKVIIFPTAKAVSEHRLTVGQGYRGVLRRDGFVCQYDGCTHRATTVDHVVPRCQGGRTTWTNLVGCCLACNQKKGGRTPEQAGMRLKKTVLGPRALLYERFETLVKAVA